MENSIKDRIYHAAVYVRLSKEDSVSDGDTDKEESESIVNQKELIRAFLADKPDIEVCGEWADDGYSGVNFERPGIKKLLSLAGKTVDCILVKDFSRFGRNLVEVGDYLDQIFPFLGVRFIAVNEGYDSGKGLGSSVSLDVSLKAMVYEMYSRDISEKLQCVKRAKMRKGEYQCAISFYGYKKSETEKNKLEIDEPAAMVVRKIFQMAGGGMRPTQIALELNREGIPSPLMYRRANHTDGMRGWKVVGDAVWMRENVRRILLDERYTGCLVGHKRVMADMVTKRTEAVPREEWIVARDTQEAIVTEQEYLKAQEVIKHYVQKPQRKPFQKFRGILKCGCCGRVLVRKAGKKPYFICLTARSIKDSDCMKVHMEEATLEEAVLEAIRVQVELYCDSMAVPVEKSDVCLQKEIRDCRMSVSRYKSLQASAFEDYAEGRISKQEYLSGKQESVRLLEQLDSWIRDLNEQLAAQQVQQAGQEADMGRYASVEELTREVLVELIKEIRVSGENRIEIKWNFCESTPI